MPKRCAWVPEDKDFYVRYHDAEWGVPVHDDGRLFEMLLLETAQAGLSWETILKKREGYRRAFAGFDPGKVAWFDEAAIANARVFLDIAAEHGGFAKYLWAFVDGEPIVNAWKSLGEVPASTPLSDALAKDLKKRGMRFVGSTTMYAYMQSVGLVNDHLVSCFRHAELASS